MKIVQICVASPMDIEIDGKTTSTSIFKTPVDGEVFVDFENLHGDRQADLSVHGGPDRALYIYSAEYYADWAQKLGRAELEPAQFGENLTVTGCRDEEIVIGSRLRVGTVVVVVTQPRIPCFKLGMRIGDADFPNQFWIAGRLGFYVRVEQTGTVKRGDDIEILEIPEHRITLRDLWRIVTAGSSDEARHAQDQLQDLDEGWLRRLRRVTKSRQLKA